MRIAVAGATGRIGRLTMAALDGAGHQAVPLSRAAGVDAYTGSGLADALRGADALIDVINNTARDEAEIVDFFGTTTRNLLAAGYRVESRIGAGGMAMVFRARAEKLGRTVALKILTPVLAEDREFRERFDRESRAVVAVDHPHIIPVYAAGEASGVLYLAMRFISGKPARRPTSTPSRASPTPSSPAPSPSPAMSRWPFSGAICTIPRHYSPSGDLICRPPPTPCSPGHSPRHRKTGTRLAANSPTRCETHSTPPHALS